MIQIERTELGDITFRDGVDGDANEVTVPAEHADIAGDLINRMANPECPAQTITLGNDDAPRQGL